MLNRCILILLVLTHYGCASMTGIQPRDVEGAPAELTGMRIVPASDVDWTDLNPARGALSPRAATLWGDRGGDEHTGFLVRFADGFSSPPHIHNVSYRAVVIEGAVHNDDPAAPEMWMGPGSFWTQPAGQNHITAAKGASNIALVEIDSGPYLVKPLTDAFDNGERPVNVDASNVVWLPLDGQSGPIDGAAIAYLWGGFTAGQWGGSFVRLPPGFAGTLKATGQDFNAVVVRGSLAFKDRSLVQLLRGSYFGIRGASEHPLDVTTDSELVLYVSADGPYMLR